ncbi:hypothetical protein F4680DRAFT_450184 [Xylaria scruposa]|nr:hypothetical protein F4680DRAFT_450184 [Xylaria scruposa]
MDMVYDSSRPSTHYERILINDWKWLNINTINPTQFSQNAAVIDDNGRPDRLNRHSHHGESTHCVITGDLRILRIYEPRLLYEISDAIGAERQDHVPPKTLYSATSKRGCTFVEGHKCLSPKSAERFISRGTLKVVDKSARKSFPTNEQLGIWLRQVKFNPNGKAFPDLSRGEMPILDDKGVEPRMPDDVYADLSQWFENEWQEPKPSRSDDQTDSWVLWSIVILILYVALARCF